MMAPGLTENPNYKIETQRMKQRVEVFIEGEKVVETRSAIMLLESGYAPVIYIPREDITGIELIKSGDYYCPYKGHASIYNVKHGASRFEEAAWSYEKTFDDFREIKKYVAFYPNKVQFIRITG